MAEMTESQRKAMIEFHRKAEKAYRDAGLTKQADAAKEKREELERNDPDKYR